MDDNRQSITIVHVGNAEGCQGPQIYLAAGRSIEATVLKDLHKNCRAPQHSKVIMTTTAYMTDDAWEQCALVLAKGIRNMEVTSAES
jgi:hypothetical protein